MISTQHGSMNVQLYASDISIISLIVDLS